ncbi:hypothetical protein [Hymenobacter rubidus]|uniref:hypothetical protein n=1 Tax=Hymenobacter rubidus TaxID=1441626 RepID=UPI00191ECD47|nr:hypothetical protein [Hymenobacter rubidus]
METQTTFVKIYTDMYRHVPERILPGKDDRYHELQELLYLITHGPDTTPDQEARRLVEALKDCGMVRPRYYVIVDNPNWTAVSQAHFSDT